MSQNHGYPTSPNHVTNIDEARVGRGKKIAKAALGAAAGFGVVIGANQVASALDIKVDDPATYKVPDAQVEQHELLSRDDNVYDKQGVPKDEIVLHMDSAPTPEDSHK